MFDGSSIDGWKAINESDMTYHARCQRFPSLIRLPLNLQLVIVLRYALTRQLGNPYERDPRSIAKRAD